MRKSLAVSLSACAAWLILLLLLVNAESAAEGASIQTFSDAFWYSIVTLSTVGYGDLYPVTAAGRVIGLIFVVLSVGLLAVIISSLITLLHNEMIPSLRMWIHRNSTWNIFNEWNDAAASLAERLDGFHIICGDTGQKMSRNILVTKASAAAIAEKHPDSRVFLISEDEYANSAEADMHADKIYFRGRNMHAGNIHCFDAMDCTARLYWEKWPLKNNEQTVMLIGMGEYGQQILYRALNINVFRGIRRITYHVFGDASEFCRLHPYLSQIFALNRPDPEADSIYFHNEEWNSDISLVTQADRIIICTDSMEENLKILGRLRTWYAVSGRVMTRFDRSIGGEDVFGKTEELYTPDLVIKEKLNHLARSMHEIYRNSADYEVDPWEKLSEFMKQSNIAAAGHLMCKIRILLDDDSLTELTADYAMQAYEKFMQIRYRTLYRELEHERWMRFHILNNWQYSEVRNNKERKHPLLVPFDQLDEKTQAKDDYAWLLLKDVAEYERRHIRQ